MNLTALWIRHVAYPMMEKRKGNRIRTYLQELSQTEKLSNHELRRWQEDHLQKLLLHAITQVPAYKDQQALTDLITRDPFEALSQFPLLTKDRFKEDQEAYLAKTADKNACILNRTGGSTGKPMTFYMDRQTVEHYEAARFRGLSWSQIRIGDPCVMIWGSPIELSAQAQRKERFKERILKNRIVIPAFDLKKDELPHYIKRIESYHPRYIYGWASALALFASFMLEKNIRLSVPLHAVVNTGETLYPHQRELIEKAFACKVINEYGARDGGIIAYECPKGGLHTTVENAVYEVVDMQTLQPVAPGEKGLLVVTDLHNYVMPRIRYVLTDVVAFSPSSCACGRTLPLIEAIEGRENDTFVALDGSYINGQYFTNIARMILSIQQFQIIQKSRDQVELLIVPHEDFTEQDIEKFKEGIRLRMGDVKIDAKRVTAIAPAASGKLLVAMREFPLPR
nr:phenylacetate--CoA ligase family protein [Bacilli bacterium]